MLFECFFLLGIMNLFIRSISKRHSHNAYNFSSKSLPQKVKESAHAPGWDNPLLSLVAIISKDTLHMCVCLPTTASDNLLLVLLYDV